MSDTDEGAGWAVVPVLFADGVHVRLEAPDGQTFTATLAEALRLADGVARIADDWRTEAVRPLAMPP